MNTLVPNRFLFDLEFALSHRKTLPAIDARLTGWTDVERLPSWGAVDGKPEFASIWACWNESGICIACRVTGKKKRLQCDAANFREGDNLRLCTNMRDARTNKRATRFCQQFYFLPTGGGPKRDQALAGISEFQRAAAIAPPIEVKRIRVASRVEQTGYTLEAHIPAECLVGFDPVEHPRIGFYHMLEDGDHGQQYLTVGDDLLWYADPSTWATAVLQR